MKQLLEKFQNTGHHAIVNEFANTDECDQIVDLLDDALDDEEYENGIVFRSIPKAFLNVVKSSVTQKILELTDRSFQKELIKIQSDDFIDDLHVVYKIGFEIYQPGSSNERKSYIDRFKDSVSLKLFVCDSNDFQVTRNQDSISLKSGDLVAYKDDLNVQTQVVNATDCNLYVITLAIKTELVNPKIIHNQSDSEVGVIIDCKDTESSTNYNALEYGLANFTRQNLVKNGFSNITAFISRKDFDTCVYTLKRQGVKKIMYIFAGTVVENDTFAKVESTETMTAWKENDIIYRRYLIFDADEFDYFQIKGEFLANLVDDITPAIPEYYGIYYLQPEAHTCKFLENIFDGIVPDMDQLGDSATRLEYIEAEKLISGIKDIVLNTV